MRVYTNDLPLLHSPDSPNSQPKWQLQLLAPTHSPLLPHGGSQIAACALNNSVGSYVGILSYENILHTFITEMSTPSLRASAPKRARTKASITTRRNTDSCM